MTVTRTQLPALAERFIRFLERPDVVPEGLFAPDVAADFNIPRWRYRLDGVEALSRQLWEDAPNGATVTPGRFAPTPTGFAVEGAYELVNEAGEDRYYRSRATVERIAGELSADGFVYRYVTDGVDGLSGDEATFAICSFWLIECLARAGESERARELFERLLSYCNDLGLLAEEIDPHSGEMLGNFPQAFSHLGIIQAAIALDLPAESMSARAAELAAS